MDNRVISDFRLSFSQDIEKRNLNLDFRFCVSVAFVFYQGRKNVGTSCCSQKNVLAGIMNKTAALENTLEPSCQYHDIYNDKEIKLRL